MKLPPSTQAFFITTGTAAVAMVLVLLGSQELLRTDPAQAVPPSRHRHNHEGMTWPPQPRGIANVVVRSTMAEEEYDHRIKRARMDRLEQKAKADIRAIQELGNRFTPITVLEKDDKEDDEDKNHRMVVSQLVFFSHDKNATVEVGFDADETIESVTVTPAQEYQPEITNEEIKDAANLARKYFISQGFKRIAGLRPYGILAYRPEGKGFFDTRVIYVSFHTHDDAPPQLAAWVDLTNQRILEVREEL